MRQQGRAVELAAFVDTPGAPEHVRQARWLRQFGWRGIKSRKTVPPGVRATP
jgi:hypothetical protein